MEKDLVDIVMEKSYIELSTDEKVELGEFCNSESEYNQLKDVFLGVEMMQFETPTPKKETKESLDSLFDSTHPRVAPIWYMTILAFAVPKEKSIHRQPLIQIAAIGLLFFLAYPFFQADVVGDVPQFSQVEYPEPILNDVKLVAPEVVKDPVITVVDVPKRIVLAAIEPQSAPSIGTTMQALGAGHSDGVFDPNNELAFSQPASEEPDMLDLLTAAF